MFKLFEQHPRPGGRLRERGAWWICLAAILTGCFVPQSAVASEDQLLVAKIKAAFVLNFARYTQWPRSVAPGEDEAVRVLVIGDELLAEVLTRTVEQRTSEDQRVEIRSLADWRPLADEAVQRQQAEEAWRALGRPHAIYFGQQPRAAAPLVNALGKAGVLTIGDTTDFIHLGGMMALGLEDGKPVFYVAESRRLRDAGLEISSRLLRLGRPIRNR